MRTIRMPKLVEAGCGLIPMRAWSSMQSTLYVGMQDKCAMPMHCFPNKLAARLEHHHGRVSLQDVPKDVKTKEVPNANITLQIQWVPFDFTF